MTEHFTVRLEATITLKVPVEAVNEQEAEALALEKAQKRWDSTTVLKALSEAPLRVRQVTPDAYELDPMELPIEYDAPKVR